MIVKELKEGIKRVLKNLDFNESDFVLEHPENIQNGDYSTNVAMILARNLGENPLDLAKKIKNEIEKDKPSFIKEITVAKPGFINFFLSDSFFEASLQEILDKGANFGKNNNLKKQKTIIEYTDPNPFKEFHIGHVMSNAIGESLSRIFEYNGAEVKRANYQGDVGIHVARAVAEKLKNKREWRNEKDVAQSYAEGSRLYEEDKNFADFVVEINKKIYLKNDNEINKIYELGKKLTLEYFEKLYKILDTKFDYYFFESTTAEFGKALVATNKKVFEESDGAVVYRGEERDKALHTRVFINKEGIPTYEAKELGLAKIKYDTYPYDQSIVLTANEVNDYFRVVLSALKEIFPDLAKKTLHLSHGMMKLPSGKMSSHTGEIITAESLIDEVKRKALEKIESSDRNIADKEKLAEQIAVGSVKYSILKQAPGRDIIFDINTALSFEGDSGPYLQYTNARISSLLENGKKSEISAKISGGATSINLGRMIYRFPEIVERAYLKTAPQYISNFLIEVAGLFNSFYAQNLIINEKNMEISSHRLAIAKAVSHVIQNGLHILGISSPEKM